MEITSATKIVGLMGHPVVHSLSPIVHNHLYISLGYDMIYHAFDVKPKQVETAVKGFVALGFTGFNVTIPFKETVYGLVDIIDNDAQIIGAVNTVKIDNGKLIGYNTDGQGFLQSLKQSGCTVYGKNIAVLGAGGAARAIATALAGEKPESITIINRTCRKAEALADVINHYNGCELVKTAQTIPKDIEIIINTTCVGMWPNVEDNPLHGYTLNSRTFVCDIVYNPEETLMLQYAKLQGCNTCGGLGMLIGQGLKAVEIWLDHQLPPSAWQIMADAAIKCNV